MKLGKIVAIGVIANLLLCPSAFAKSKSFANTETGNWDKPAKGTLKAFGQQPKLTATAATLQWTDSQLKQIQTPDNPNRIPALRIDANHSYGLRPTVMLTDLPGAKFERNFAGDTHDKETLTVSAMGFADIAADKDYTVSAAWVNAKDNNPFFSLHSLQRFAQPAKGTIVDLPASDDYLAGLRWSDAEITASNDPGPSHSAQDIEDVFEIRKHVDGKVKGDYGNIRSKEALDRYKEEAGKLLDAAPDEGFVRFAVTFGKPVSLESLAKENNLDISQFYAVGVTEDKQEYTMSWFRQDDLFVSPEGFHPGFVQFGITEIEGTALGQDLKRLSADGSVDLIDVEDNGRTPTGVYWLNKRYNK